MSRSKASARHKAGVKGDTPTAVRRKLRRLERNEAQKQREARNKEFPNDRPWLLAERDRMDRRGTPEMQPRTRAGNIMVKLADGTYHIKPGTKRDREMALRRLEEERTTLAELEAREEAARKRKEKTKKRNSSTLKKMKSA